MWDSICLFVRGNKSRHVLVMEMLKKNKKIFFWGKPGMNGCVLLTTGNLGLLFILSREFIYHLCILQSL